VTDAMTRQPVQTATAYDAPPKVKAAARRAVAWRVQHDLLSPADALEVLQALGLA
jgi:hypothetical protein